MPGLHALFDRCFTLLSHAVVGGSKDSSKSSRCLCIQVTIGAKMRLNDIWRRRSRRMLKAMGLRGNANVHDAFNRYA